LTVQQFDNIYDKEITKRYAKHEIQRLSKKYQERETSAGRPFKLDLIYRYSFTIEKQLGVEDLTEKINLI
jgi:hypothetical protein